MIVVRVELHSAITGKVTELARMVITNAKQDKPTRADYRGWTVRGRKRVDGAGLARAHRWGYVKNHAKKQLHVWHLVSKMLQSMEYGE